MAFSQREMERMDGMCPHGPLSSNCKTLEKEHNSPNIASSRYLSRLFSFRRSVSEWGEQGERERGGGERQYQQLNREEREGGRQRGGRKRRDRGRNWLQSDAH